MSGIKINREYKDRLFCYIFGSYEMRENVISLYNALTGTNYTDEKDFKITTLGDVLYIKMKNDVSILIDSYLVLWEQQSSYNPNMPVRGLMYFGKLYDAYIDANKLNIYGQSLVKIPTPKYVVFYNGQSAVKEVKKLKLSDAFIQEDKSGEFEWTATMYNLNKGKNENLLDKCKPLKDYMTLINRIRENQALGMKMVEAVECAVISCIEDDILAEFLKKKRSEVVDVCLTEYNETVFVNGIREEGRLEGLEEGKKEGRLEGLEEGKKEGRLEGLEEGELKMAFKLIKNKHLSLEAAIENSDVDRQLFLQKWEEYNKQ